MSEPLALSLVFFTLRRRFFQASIRIKTELRSPIDKFSLGFATGTYRALNHIGRLVIHKPEIQAAHESSLSNSFRVAGKAAFEVLSHW
jgi:hypothetical protein